MTSTHIPSTPKPHAPAHTATPPEPWTIASARTLYNIEGWGIGYFDINDAGHVVVRPDREKEDRELDLFNLANDLEEQGVGLPLLLRFSDILRSRIESLNQKFARAREEYGYEGGYTTVFPIKVNQQRHVVEEIVEFGKSAGVGLECGSKPELQAVLGLAEHTDHLIVCNGYKDEEFMRLALMGQKLGHQVFIVLEQLSEVDVLLKVADELGVKPTAGVRIKLYSEGSGRWAKSGGEKSKFGLSTAQLVRLVDKLKALDRLDILKLIHFHLGSQITDIRYIKAGLQEISRYYAELRGMGVDITHVDVGGGLGVDYDGSGSTSQASVNYSLQEYADDVIYTLAEACREHELVMPHIISESGRALTAHHALLLLSVIDVESQADNAVPDLTDDDHSFLHEMAADYASMSKRVSKKRVREVFHDATFDKERAQELFNSGVLTLRDRAIAEQIYLATIAAVAKIAQRDRDEYSDIIEDLEATLVDRYFCNFSLFQSLPDSWAIDQLFPIMPIHRLDEEPTRRGTIQDVTCDSDGKIERFIGDRTPVPSLELHPFSDDARLYDPTEGRITLDGVDLREYDLASLRHAIGVIFQDFVRYDMRFDENIGVGEIESVRTDLDRHNGTPSSISDAAENSLAASLLPRFTKGYQQMLGRRFDDGVDLSGGEWQKIALARAYIRDAQVLILDEPTAALDARAEYEVFLRFSELVAGRMAILISHRFSTVRMADRIIVLRNGKVEEQGSHEELLANGGLYEELFTMQAAGYR